ncbi:uncharacterized protein LOC117261249 [Epinephelus lanceolatus]
MTGVRNSLAFTQSDALADVVSGQSCHIVLETSPPDYVEKISRYLESNEGHSRQNEVTLFEEAADADSDSGDSLFITQKAVPEPVRSGRRRRHLSLRSNLTFPGDHKESDENNSSSASPEESKTGKERRKKYTLPKYRFPFLPEKSRRNLLPAQNGRLHNYVMGGFFKCVRELWQSYQRAEDLESSLPTVDIDGEDISPLSEEDEGKAEDEDIKVVERKRFMALSKAKQIWGSQSNQQRRRKAGNAGKETVGGGRTKTLSKKTVKAALLKDIPILSDTDCSDKGEPTHRGLVQKERTNEHTTTDTSSLAQSEILKAKKRLTFQRKATEEELCDDSDATVCEPCELPRSPRPTTQKEGEASTPVAEPQTDVLHTDDTFATGQAGDGPEREHLSKKRKKKKTDKGDNEGVEEGKGQSLEEPEALHAATCVNSLHNDNTPRQDEGDTPDPKHKKKKRKKNKPAVENVEQEEDGNLESDVRAEEGGKKKSKRSGEDIEQLQSSTVAEPLNDEVKKKKKKKRKKEEEAAITEEHEEEEALNRTSNLLPILTEQLEEPGNCLESAAASSQETFIHVKKKKHKKKRQSSSNDATQHGEEGVDVNFSIDNSVTSAKGSGMSLKMKKAIFENIFDSPEQKEKVENIGDTQKTEEGIEDQNTELVSKKSEICSRGISEDGVAQSDDSVSVQEKEERRTSSFLVADAKENNAQTHGEQNSPSQSRVSGTEKPGVSAGCSVELNGIVKKKRKRKESVAQDSRERPHFEEANEKFQNFIPETTDTGVKRKKKHAGNESEAVTTVKRYESAADAGLSPPDEAVVLKRKKKFQDHLIQQDPPAATDNAEPVTSSLNKTKGKHSPSAEMSLDSTTTENLAINDVTHKKKKKKKKPTNDVLREGKSLTEPAELEPREKKKKERNKPSAVPSSPVSSEASLSKAEMLSPDNNTKNKHRKVKRRLYDPSEDVCRLLV